MLQDRLISTFLDLLKIEALAGKERDVASYIIRIANAEGLKAIEDNGGRKIDGNSGNIIVMVEGKRKVPPLLFLSHMDVVDTLGALNPVIKGSAVQSAGHSILGADDRAGVAVMLEVMRVLASEPEKCGKVSFVFTISEEKGLKGARALDCKSFKNSFAYVLDSSSIPGTIIRQAPFYDAVNAEIFGKAAHSGIEPEAGISAIRIAADAILSMKLGRVDSQTTANIGIIKGGIATNIIPDQVEMKGEARSQLESKLKRQVSLMEKCMVQSALKAGGKVKFYHHREFNGYFIKSDEPVIKQAVEAAKRIKICPALEASGGGSDANILNEKGVKSVVLGVGFKNPHSKTESMDLKDLINVARWVLEIITL